MWKNYLLAALRNFKRSRFFTTINVLGLGIGLATVIVIFLFIHKELSYDKYHSKSERIYRQIKIGNEHNAPIQPGAFYEFQKEEVPGIKELLRVKKYELVVRTGEQKMPEQPFLVADSNLFSLFDWHAYMGDPVSALQKTNTVILTRSAAQKYFGDEDPIGREVLFENTYNTQVGAVIEDIPDESFVHFSGILPVDYVKQTNPSALTHWGNSSFQYFCLLKENADPEKVAEDIAGSWVRNSPGQSESYPLYLQALEKIHLHSTNIRWEIEPQGSITTVRILAVTAALILILACINFINLSTARNARRFREVGLRKVLGSSRKQVIHQFMLETSIYILVSVIIAFIIAEISLPWFSGFSGYELSIYSLATPEITGIVILFLLVLIAIAGSYPAFVLSSFSPTDALKSTGTEVSVKGKKRFSLREGLVVLQFVISIGLITGAYLVHRQFSYLTEKNLGFEKSQKLAVVNPWDQHMNDRFDAFRQEIRQIPGVKASTGTHNLPGDFQNNYSGLYLKGKKDERMNAAIISVENNFFEVMGADIPEGQSFPSSLSETAKDSLVLCIINESLARIIRNHGFENPVGETLEGFWDRVESRKIIGIAEDMHFRSLHNKVYPAVFVVSKYPYPNYVRNMILDVNTADISGTMDRIGEAWNKISPDWPFQGHFLDQRFEELYAKEDKLSGLISIFTFLALFVSLIGLLAVVLFTLQSRVREIGIRKVLGASNRQLFGFMSWKFLRLALIADIIALPIIWYITSGWLNQFAYRISIQWWIFAAAVLFSVIFTFMAVFYQTYKSIRKNPVNSLKYE